MTEARGVQAITRSEVPDEGFQPKIAAADVERAPTAGRTLVLAACMMATFMAAVESSIVATAMPTIVADLGGFNLFSGLAVAMSDSYPVLAVSGYSALEWKGKGALNETSGTSRTPDSQNRRASRHWRPKSSVSGVPIP